MTARCGLSAGLECEASLDLASNSQVGSDYYREREREAMKPIMGSDVGKRALAVYITATGKSRCVGNTQAGIAKLVRTLSVQGADRLVV
jgi:hypothetical protein